MDCWVVLITDIIEAVDW